MGRLARLGVLGRGGCGWAGGIHSLHSVSESVWFAGPVGEECSLARSRLTLTRSHGTLGVRFLPHPFCVCVHLSFSRFSFSPSASYPSLPLPLLSSGKHDCAKDIRSQASAGGGGVLKGRSHVLPPEFPSLSQVSLGLYV